MIEAVDPLEIVKKNMGYQKTYYGGHLLEQPFHGKPDISETWMKCW
jgi:hypothetical protein